MVNEEALKKLKNIYSNLGEDIPSFNEFQNKDIIEKEFKIANIAISNFDIYDKIIIIGSRFPINYIYKFNQLGIDNIIVIDYHPILDKHKDLLNVDVVIKRPLFDDLTKFVQDADLVVFPNTEYMVPLIMLNYYKHCKNVIAVNHINIKHNFNNYIVEELNQFKNDCNLNDGEKYKFSNCNVYYAFGNNICL